MDNSSDERTDEKVNPVRREPDGNKKPAGDPAGNDKSGERNERPKSSPLGP